MKTMKTTQARKEESMTLTIPAPKQRFISLPSRFEKNRKAYNRRAGKRVD